MCVGIAVPALGRDDSGARRFSECAAKTPVPELDRTPPLRSRLSTNLGQVYPYVVRVHP
jgi:hypothetical protein